MPTPSPKALAALAFLLAAATLTARTTPAPVGDPTLTEASAVETLTRRGTRLRPPLAFAAAARAEPVREATLTRRGVRTRPAAVETGDAVVAFVRYEAQPTRRGLRLRAVPAEMVASLP